MGTKRITALTAASAMTDDKYVPADDGIETFKVSGVQLADYVLAQRPVGTTAISSSSGGSATTTNTSYTDVNNLSVSLVVSGTRPVVLELVADGDATGGNEALCRIRRSSGNTADAQIAFLRDSTKIGCLDFEVSDSGLTDIFENLPISALRHTDYAPAAGTYTYKVQAKVASGTTGVDMFYCKLIAREV